MITVRMGRRASEAHLALLIAGETVGRVYTNYPIKGHTRKLRGKQKYLVIKGTV